MRMQVKVVSRDVLGGYLAQMWRVQRYMGEMVKIWRIR